MNAWRSTLSFLLTVAGLVASGCIAASDSEDQETDGPEPIAESSEASSSGTVAHALATSCSTDSVRGLSEQIIEEGNCLSDGAYAKVPDLGNVSFGASVFPYLEKPARDRLVATLKAHPGTHMTINSMLRTVAQQYLLYTWFENHQCGIKLAAHPGSSNHETGLAMDVSQFSTWKSALASHGFQWFGSADPVHFDYVGSGAVSHKGLDVKAFQKLWNRNHPEDTIAADGEWGPATEARLRKAPAAGFAKGPTCGAPPPPDQGPPSDRIGVSTYGPGRLDLFARDEDHHLTHRVHTDGHWGSWKDLGGKISSAPAAVSWASGRIDVFAQDTDAHLVHKWWSDGAWHGWEDLGGHLTSAPVVVSQGEKSLDVFARGKDDHLVHKYFRAGTGWSSWKDLGGNLASTPAAASWAEGRLDVFARNTDDKLLHIYFNGNQWSAWKTMQGPIRSGPMVTSWGEGRLDVFATGGKDQLVHRWYKDGAWSDGWEDLGGKLVSPPTGVSWGDHRIDVFARGGDNVLVHKYFSSTGWHDFKHLGDMP
jgi:hypothetical protein